MDGWFSDPAMAVLFVPVNWNMQLNDDERCFKRPNSRVLAKFLLIGET